MVRARVRTIRDADSPSTTSPRGARTEEWSQTSERVTCTSGRPIRSICSRFTCSGPERFFRPRARFMAICAQFADWIGRAGAAARIQRPIALEAGGGRAGEMNPGINHYARPSCCCCYVTAQDSHRLELRLREPQPTRAGARRLIAHLERRAPFVSLLRPDQVAARPDGWIRTRARLDSPYSIRRGRTPIAIRPSDPSAALPPSSETTSERADEGTSKQKSDKQTDFEMEHKQTNSLHSP